MIIHNNKWKRCKRVCGTTTSNVHCMATLTHCILRQFFTNKSSFVCTFAQRKPSRGCWCMHLSRPRCGSHADCHSMYQKDTSVVHRNRCTALRVQQWQLYEIFSCIHTPCVCFTIHELSTACITEEWISRFNGQNVGESFFFQKRVVAKFAYLSCQSVMISLHREHRTLANSSIRDL